MDGGISATLYWEAAGLLAAACVIAWINYRFARKRRRHLKRSEWLIRVFVSSALVVGGITGAVAMVTDTSRTDSLLIETRHK
jgi:hypothetical protein